MSEPNPPRSTALTLRFDSQQPHQQAAIDAIVALFAGQPDAGLAPHPLGLSNRLTLGPEALTANLQAVQTRAELPVSKTLDAPHFSLEMETGTGKTYVMLRAMHELYARYGLAKFVIVVPSVAIREGVTKTLAITRAHFAELYAHPPADAWVYDASRLSRLRAFAEGAHLQVMVLNIDAFNKQLNLMNKPQDRLGGHQPIAFVRAARPVVILDEPQNMASELARAAIDALDPLFTLRFSATHREAHHLIHRLDPVSAYDLGLVKRIEVTSVQEEAAGAPYVRLEAVSARAKRLSARVSLDVRTPEGLVRETRVVADGDELEALSGGHAAYRGFRVNGLDAARGRIRFANGIALAVGEAWGEDRDALMRAQIHETVREHLEKERALAERGEPRRLKVLSLFFIDRVANYAPADGKLRRWFEAAYRALAAEPRYAGLGLPPVAAVHGGYFATAKGQAKDTDGGTKADDEIYALIMRDKERLLSPDEPLRFIFSHSALREGWDNPNVFQICTLNETHSEIKKRQEVGRGLRLAVWEDGARCDDPSINRLTVIANERYEAFCRALQAEIREATGRPFEGRIQNRRTRRRATLREGWDQHPAFLALWDALGRQTRYSVNFSTEALIAEAAAGIAALPAPGAPRVVARKASLDLGRGTATLVAETAGERAEPVAVPDAIGYLQRETGLMRQTLAAMLARAGRDEALATNPTQFLERVRGVIRRAYAEALLSGIRYAPSGVAHEAARFAQRPPEGDERHWLPVSRGLHDVAWVENEAERHFVAGLDAREDVALFFRLPGWCRVDSPEGPLEGGWVVALTDGRLKVVEPAPVPPARERCLRAHFAALGVPYEVVADATAL